MRGRHHTPAEREAIERDIADGLSDNRIAKKRHASRRTVAGIRKDLEAVACDISAPEMKPAPPTRREIHDAAFWRGRANAQEKEIARLELLTEELAGVRKVPVSIPDWVLSTGKAKSSRSVLGLLLSDVHMGEVIDPEELLGLNAFDEDICRKRLRRYFDASCTIGQRWAADCNNQGAVVFLAGDMISGDIHEELRITNALTAHEQVRACVEEMVRGIQLVLETYGRVHVVGVPGNHGRTTFKPTAKLYSRLSYDMLIVSMVGDYFRDNSRVTMQFSRAFDQIVPMVGWSVLCTHGDKMGTGGGQGFAGPVLPIIRGTKKVEAQQARANRRPDLIVHGHYHTEANPGPVLSNGSVPGYSEYGNGLRASLEPPSQWLFLMTERWGLRERVGVRLEELTVPPKPRGWIPAAMGERFAA